MKKLLSVLLVITCNIVIAATEIHTTVTSVHDGDGTIKFKYNGEIVKGRLKGIDAPELKQEYGKEAKEFLSDLILGKEVDIVIDNNTGRYGRYLVTVYLGLENVNRMMVENGYAWDYMDDGKYKIYRDMAEREKLGLWDGTNIMSPSTFRKMGKKEYYVKLLDNPNPACRTAEFKTCGEFDDCLEALFWSDMCGHTYLDRNDNGIPCETICK